MGVGSVDYEHQELIALINRLYEDYRERGSLERTGDFLGELYANTGRNDKALKNLNKALSMCQEMGIEYWPDKIKEVLHQL